MKNNTKAIGTFILVILFGVLLAANYYLFIIPNGFAPAGINGIAVMVQYKLGFSVGYMSLLINVPLCIAAFFLIDRKYAVLTLTFCLSYSFSFLYLQNSGILSAFQYNAQGTDTIYPVLLSGLISGFIYSQSFIRNSSTGGTDIVARYTAKKKPQLNFFWITFALDAVVAFASYFVYAQKVDGRYVYDMKPVCLCLFYCFTSSFVGSEINKRAKATSEFIIITDNAEAIEKEIVTHLRHSATRIQATGVYSNTEKTVLICIINKNQVHDFVKILNRYPGTFAIAQNATAIIGNYKYVLK